MGEELVPGQGSRFQPDLMPSLRPSSAQPSQNQPWTKPTGENGNSGARAGAFLHLTSLPGLLERGMGN